MPGELGIVDTDGQDLDPAETDREHLPAVVVRIRHPDTRPMGELGELFVPEPDQPPERLVGEIPLRGQIVVHGDDLIG